MPAWLKRIKNAFSSSADPLQVWEKDRERFFRALRKDNAEAVRSIAAKYPKEALAWESPKGPPLRVAQEAGSAKAFAALLDLGADPNQTYAMPDRKITWHSSPLHRAVETGRLDLAALLIDRGARLDKRDYRCNIFFGLYTITRGTPLASAIDAKNKAAAVFLLERGFGANDACQEVESWLAPGKPSSLSSLQCAAAAKDGALILDLIKRADLIRAAYLEKHPEDEQRLRQQATAPEATPAAAPGEKRDTPKKPDPLKL
jgi:ankyrin repeat protein